MTLLICLLTHTNQPEQSLDRGGGGGGGGAAV